MSRMVTIVDSGCANISSVKFAFERLGARVAITEWAEDISNAERVVLPGVGAARHAAENLRARGLWGVLRALERPVLGVCLGMQLMCGESAEGDTAGLGVLDGRVESLPPGEGMPVPHMGWNRLEKTASSPLIAGVDDGAHVYFVHSYALPVGAETIAAVQYTARFSAVVARGNYFGCQFHPERSGDVGAVILENFLGL